jgi:hypothetical protein
VTSNVTTKGSVAETPAQTAKRSARAIRAVVLAPGVVLAARVSRTRSGVVKRRKNY